MAEYSIYKSTTCSTYIVEAGSNPIEFRVYKLGVDGLFDEVTDAAIEVEAEQSYSYVISIDGVYRFDIVESSDTHHHISINYCNARTCIANKIEDLLCCCKNDCESEDHYDFNALIAISNGFFGLEDIVESDQTLRNAGDALTVGVDYEVLVGAAGADFSTSGGPGVGAVDDGDNWTAISTDVDVWSTAVLTKVTGSFLDDLVVYAKAIEMATNYCSDCQTICAC